MNNAFKKQVTLYQWFLDTYVILFNSELENMLFVIYLTDVKTLVIYETTKTQI